MCDALLYQQKIMTKVSKLNNEVVYTSDIYFERAKEQVSFLYPNLDLSQMEFLKVIYDGQLVDEEAEAFQEPKKYAPNKKTHDKGGEMGCGE